MKRKEKRLYKINTLRLQTLNTLSIPSYLPLHRYKNEKLHEMFEVHQKQVKISLYENSAN